MIEAALDRYEEDYAVFVRQDTGEALDIPRAMLPDDLTLSEGDHVRLKLDDDGALVTIERDDDATEAARQRIAEKLKRLRRGDHLKDSE